MHRRSNNKTLLGALKTKFQYFGDKSGLHGVGHVCSMSPIPLLKRVFWVIVLGLCCFGAASVLQSALGLYAGDIISFSVETNYLKFNTPFPAITVCESLEGTKKEKITEFMTSKGFPSTLKSFFEQVYHWSIVYCGVPCLRCNPNVTCIENFQNYTALVRKNCSELLTDCWWKGEYFSCCDRFLPMPTEFGECYSFNSQLASNASTIYVNRKTGLPTLKLTSPYPNGILIRVHGPDEAVSTSMDNIFDRKNSALQPGTVFEVYIKAEQTVSDVSIGSLTQFLRGCLYPHERPSFATLWPFQWWPYSYSTCILYCRAMEQVELCNCTHHFMPRLKNVPVCDIRGMGCLGENQAQLTTVDCACPMACEEVMYELVHLFVDKPAKGKKPAPRNISAQIGFATLPTLMVRRQTIRGIMGLVGPQTTWMSVIKNDLANNNIHPKTTQQRHIMEIDIPEKAN